MQYESSITSGMKDMAKDSRAMTLAPGTYMYSWLAKKYKL